MCACCVLHAVMDTIEVSKTKFLLSCSLKYCLKGKTNQFIMTQENSLRIQLCDGNLKIDVSLEYEEISMD